MTEAMLFLQKTILLSYDPRPLRLGVFFYDVYKKIAVKTIVTSMAIITTMALCP